MYQHNGKFIDSHNGAYFDGTSYVTIPSPINSVLTEMSLLFRLNQDTFNFGDDSLIHLIKSYSSSYWFVEISYTGKTFTISLKLYNGSFITLVSSESILTLDRIYHIGYTVDFTGGSATCYVAGEGYSRITTNSFTASFVGNENNLEIGRDYTGNNRYFNGHIGGVKIFNKVLTKEEIVTEFKGNSNLENLLGYWELESDLLDGSDNENDGIATGAITYSEMQRGLLAHDDLLLPTEINDLNVQTIKGFLGDGTTYLEPATALNIKDDFAVVFKVRIPTDFTLRQDLYGGYYTDEITEPAIIFGSLLYFTPSQTLNGLLGWKDQGRPIEVVVIPNEIKGSVVTVAMRRKSSVLSVMLESAISENVTQVVDNILDYKSPYLFATNDRFDGVDTVKNQMKGIVLESLLIQDTLTDTQLQEFSTLENFTDHSDYATLTKNAHYDFRNESANDISGNNNNATVVGTERYGVIK